MPFFRQNDNLAVTFSGLGSNDLVLERFSGVEPISGLFQFELNLLAQQQTEIDFDKVIGQPVSVRLTGAAGTTRFFHGIISELCEGDLASGADGDKTFIRYRAIMVPAVFKLTLGKDCRIFQDADIKTILRTVFKAHAIDMQDLDDTLPPRNYCVQYDESDFAFASRLLEEDGISYYFKHTENSHVMVFSSGMPPRPELRADYDPSGANTTSERIEVLKKNQRLTAGKFSVWDYHYQLAHRNQNASARVPSTVPVGGVNHAFALGGNDGSRVFQHGQFAHHFDTFDMHKRHSYQRLDGLAEEKQARAQLAMERSLAEALTLEGQSTCPAFAGGALVEVPNHFRGNTRLLLTEVRHEASIEGAYTSRGSVPFRYTNQFKAVPADLQYRPPLRTPRPRILSCQTAMVTAADDTDINTDDYGRVQVQFYWDRQADHNSAQANGQLSPSYDYWCDREPGPESRSCWLRVCQSWAGPGFGSLFLPRKGTEVVVAFLDGDPDRPVVVGSIYNSLGMPPFRLPGEAAVSGIKSRSVGGKFEDFNGILFDDTKGKENVLLLSEGNLILRTQGDLIFDIGGKMRSNSGGTTMRNVGDMPSLTSGGGGGDPEPEDDVPGANLPSGSLDPRPRQAIQQPLPPASEPVTPTHAAFPGQQPQSPGDGGSAFATVVAMPGPGSTTESIIVSPAAETNWMGVNSVSELISSGAGGGDPLTKEQMDFISQQQKAANAPKPWDKLWQIKGENFATTYTNAIEFSWGSSNKFMVGIAGGYNFLTKYDVLVDPICLIQTGWSGFSGKSTWKRIANTIFGTIGDAALGGRKVTLANTSELQLGTKTEVLLQKKVTSEWGKKESFGATLKDVAKLKLKKTLQIFSSALGGLLCAEVAAVPGIGATTNTNQPRSKWVDLLVGLILAEVGAMQAYISRVVVKDNRMVDIKDFQKDLKKEADTGKDDLQVQNKKDELADKLVLAENDKKEERKVEMLNNLGKVTIGTSFEVNMEESVFLKAKGKGDAHPASFLSVRPDLVTLACKGKSPKEAPRIDLLEKGNLFLRAGQVRTASDASIMLSPNGIVISFGTGKEKSSISLTKSGIIMEAASVSIKAGHITMDAEKTTKISGNTVGITGDTKIDKSLHVSQNIDLQGVLNQKGQSKISGPVVFS